MLKFLEFLRYHAFFLKDFFAGSPVKKHLEQIAFLNENPKQAQVVKDELLKKLLHHAYTNVPFYKHLKNKDLKNFPVVNKAMITEQYNLFVAQNYVSKRKIKLTTSGSTGSPFSMHCDINKKRRNTADSLYFAHLAGYKLGMRLYYFRFWTEYYKKSTFLQKLQNIVPVNVVPFNKKEVLQLINRLKKDNSNKCFIGHASAFKQICTVLDANPNIIKPKEIKLKVVIATSEPLVSYTKNRMSYYFNSPVVSRYSNTENGIIAQQLTDYNTDSFFINNASYHVEILDIKTNQPVPEGALGKIVITDLFNYHTPLIRYDTGDLGAIETINGSTYFKTITGRLQDAIYNTEGEVISALGLTDFSVFRGIQQGQIIQNSKTDYVIKLVVNDTFNEEELFLATYKEFLGSQANITLEFVDSIPYLKSGKFKTTINNYKKNV